MKLLIEHWVKIGPIASLGIIAVIFAVGIVASLIGDAKAPEGDEGGDSSIIPDDDDSGDEPDDDDQAKKKTSPSTA